MIEEAKKAAVVGVNMFIFTAGSFATVLVGFLLFFAPLWAYTKNVSPETRFAGIGAIAVLFLGISLAVSWAFFVIELFD